MEGTVIFPFSQVTVHEHVNEGGKPMGPEIRTL